MSLPRKWANKLAGVGSKARDVTGDFEQVFGGKPPKPSDNIGKKDLTRKTAESIKKSGDNARSAQSFYDFDRDNDGENDFTELETELAESEDDQLDRRLF